MQNVAQAAGTDASYNPIQAALQNSQPFGTMMKLADLAINDTTMLTLDDGTVFSSHFFGLVTDLSVTLTDLATSPFNGFSFAFYMYFIFAFFSPILLLGAYGWMLT